MSGKLLILGEESATVTKIANVTHKCWNGIQLLFTGHSALAHSQWGILRGDLKRFYSFLQ